MIPKMNDRDKHLYRAIVKFNGGNLALLCSSCRVIIKTGGDFTEEENAFVKGEVELPPQYCKSCEEKRRWEHIQGGPEQGSTTT
jgi:hypothetical protein